MGQKIEDLIKMRRCSINKGFNKNVEGINREKCHKQNYKHSVRYNNYICPCLLVLFMLFTAYRRLVIGLVVLFLLV